MATGFQDRLETLQRDHRAVVETTNPVVPQTHGIFERLERPILGAAHVPLDWRFDLDPATNPLLLERLGINAVFNAGAIAWEGRVRLVCRVEGWDRKSFFAIAESDDGLQRFRFIGEPVTIPQQGYDETNLYDMRLTHHEDGWIYGVFCAESHDPTAADFETSRAVAQAGIVRTKDMERWERLPNLKTPSPQQRNVVLHPEFVAGKYLLYTRPQDGFISAGSGGGIAWGLVTDMSDPVLPEETVLDPRVYHTIKESKNGAGAVPIKTDRGWIHLVHGVRECAAGLRYVVYAFVTALDEPTRVVAAPGGYLIAPVGAERVGDVSNVAFINGAVSKPDGTIVMYYASSDTRMHAAVTSQERLLDYCFNTPPDSGTSHGAVEQRLALIRKNRAR